MVGFIIFFIFIFIIVLAFKSDKKEETVTKIDKETGHTTVEKHVIDSPNSGQTAARLVLGIIGFFLILSIFIIIIVTIST